MRIINLGVHGDWKANLIINDDGTMDENRENLTGPHAGGVVTHRVDITHIKRFHPDRAEDVLASVEDFKKRQESTPILETLQKM